jgi:hypothetical protein
VRSSNLYKDCVPLEIFTCCLGHQFYSLETLLESFQAHVLLRHRVVMQGLQKIMLYRCARHINTWKPVAAD